VNGEAIYATRALPPYEDSTVSYTRSKNGKFGYAICREWPGKQLVLQGIKTYPTAVITMLGVEKPLVWKRMAKNSSSKSPRNCKTPKPVPANTPGSVKIPLG
jgi:alpha-L-fucosidase